jgi:mannose-6-phosphate isomerase-like protein (cupin superfamily)
LALQLVKTTPCKVMSEDSGGACSIFELLVSPRSGPPLHVHHRQGEWYSVLSGEFLFEPGSEQYRLSNGGSLWAPRDIRHRWANTGKTDDCGDSRILAIDSEA